MIEVGTASILCSSDLNLQAKTKVDAKERTVLKLRKGVIQEYLLSSTSKTVLSPMIKQREKTKRDIITIIKLSKIVGGQCKHISSTLVHVIKLGYIMGKFMQVID